MSKITLLSQQVRNQIAAGEVIENPASVVKELIENALDAKATNITVEVEGGGLQHIRVSDNGEGMTQQEAMLALQRHATSKIKQIDDLDDLTTMGFRGEALPSIASISKCRLETVSSSHLDDFQGILLSFEGGNLIQNIPITRQQGTTISVDSLFYNLPARKKFQRSQAQNSTQIHRVVTALALANPCIGFRLVNGGKEVISSPVFQEKSFLEGLEMTMHSLLGESFCGLMRVFQEEEGAFRCIGFLGDPSAARSNRMGQHLFLNQRVVTIPAVSAIMQEAYGMRLASGHHPLFLLHLFLPSHLVDVNVHPQKKEVRLQEMGQLKRMLFSLVNRLLNHSPLPSLPSSVQVEKSALVQSSSFVPSAHFIQTIESEWQNELAEKKEEMKEERIEASRPLQIVGFFFPYLFLHSDVLSTQIPHEEKGVAVVNLYAVEARLLWEQCLEEKSAIASEECHFPLFFSASREERKQIDPHLSFLKEVGMVLEAENEGYCVCTMPQWMDRNGVKESVLEWAEILDRGKEGELWLKQKQKDCLAKLVVRLAYRHRKTTVQQAERIVREWLKFHDPLFTPAKEKTVILWSMGDLKKMFL